MLADRRFPASDLELAVLRKIWRVSVLARGAEAADEFCLAMNSSAECHISRVMVGFKWHVRSTGDSLVPFLVVAHVAYNVQRFPKAREPTARAAKILCRLTVVTRGPPPFI
jgi:hypothetical protein